jgi:hypothetical protein
MSKHTASAAGGAMPAEGHETPSLLTIANVLDETGNLIIAASNLAAAIDDTQGQGLHAVICAAEEKFEVAHDWFLERYGASPTSDPTPSPSDPASRELLGIADDIDEVRYLIEAAWMAAESLVDNEDERAIQTLLSVAKRQLTAARNRLNVARRAQPEDIANV